MIGIINDMEERDRLPLEKGLESKVKTKKGVMTDTELGFPEGKDHTKLWKRDEFMEKANGELEIAKEGGKIKGFKTKKK